MTCSYWLMGGCRDPKEGPTPEDEEPNENSCCFLHDFLPMPAPPTPPLSALVSGAFAAAGMGAMSLPPAAAPPAASPTISPDDEEQFPALTPSKPSASSSNDKASAATTPVAAAAAAAATATATTVAKSFLQVALSTDKVKKPSPAAAAGGGGAATATAAGAASSSGGAKTVNLKDLVSRQKLASVWVIGGRRSGASTSRLGTRRRAPRRPATGASCRRRRPSSEVSSRRCGGLAMMVLGCLPFTD